MLSQLPYTVPTDEQEFKTLWPIAAKLKSKRKNYKGKTKRIPWQFHTKESQKLISEKKKRKADAKMWIEEVKKRKKNV